MRIAVVGSYGVGMTMRLQVMPRAGETVSGGSYSRGPGGKGSNQAIAAARLGANVSLFTAVGPDVLAQEAYELWRREDVDASHVVTGSKPTMVGFILVESTGENRIVIASGALDELTALDVESFRPVIRDADMLIVSMEIPLDVVVAALRIGFEEGTSTLLNPAPASPLPEEAWEWIDVVTPNQTEAPVILGLDEDHGLTNRQLVEELRRRTGAIIVLTLGSAGSLLNAGIETVAVAPITPCAVIDTTGAGDSFTAALAVALVEGQSIESAVRCAAAAGSHAVTIGGVLDALPTKEDLKNLIGINA